MIDRRPRLIARCTDVADLIAAVNFGRDNKLLVSIRSGGPNAGGVGVCDDGLVIDLSPMRNVRVDPKKKTILAGGQRTVGRRRSCRARVWSGRAGRHHLHHRCRRCDTRRRYRSPDAAVRPDVDSLLAVDMVLANGKFVTASAKENVVRRHLGDAACAPGVLGLRPLALASRCWGRSKVTKELPALVASNGRRCQQSFQRERMQRSDGGPAGG